MLPAGLELLEERYEVRSGGLEASREEILALVEGAAAVVSDTSVSIDAELLARVKPTAVLVNTARGGVVDGHAVASALREDRLWAAGLDVFENEPEVPDDLLRAPRALLLPHIGSATRRARNEMSRLAARNVVAVLEGEEPLTPVAASLKH